MSRRETAIHYLLRHRLALLLAGVVVLVDQLGTDWAVTLRADGVGSWGRLGPLALGYLEFGRGPSVALPLLLAFVGAVGLRRRLLGLRADATPSRSRPASELFVLAGAVALALSLLLRGAVVAPLSIEPLGIGLTPASVCALPAAVAVLVERPSPRAGVRGETTPNSALVDLEG